MANETITGKIFTLKDPTGTYNRFPRTVMEAVYGLIPYLQTQFGNLANIYMPIEGITETKPLQEFVYRLCPSSIKAKSVSLDRIYGKTLAWNQLMNITAVYGDKGVTATLNNDGTVTLNGTANDTGYVGCDVTSTYLISGHKVLFYSIGTAGAQIPSANTAAFITQNGSAIITIRKSGYEWGLRLLFNSGDSFSNKKVYTYLVDLTLLYGSEIDGMTDAQILAKFEAEYPGYHDYSAGKLISNDAGSMETVGFNLWDETFSKRGSFLHEDGTEDYGMYASAYDISSYIPVIAGQTYYVNKANGVAPALCFYDASKNFVSGIPHNSAVHLSFTVPAGVAFVRDSISAGVTDYCINLSDPAKNGTYEPYRKSTMQLNLGSFQVRDSQGNVTTITGGLKSAGSVRDEIVGNKYIKRVGSVDLGTLTWANNPNGTGTFYTVLSGNKEQGGLTCARYITHNVNPSSLEDKEITSIATVIAGNIDVKDTAYQDASSFAAAVSGVMLYYELATPVEYELVSPLVPTVKAGITEARISPNSDGLSAPMVADMTYDANANNDSASAQYALTAGRLLNSHKLWGQDFDGTQDVTGALTGVTSITMNGALSGATSIGMSGAGTVTGVTSINSLINISGTNVGIGTASPSAKLDVRSSEAGTIKLYRTTSTGGAHVDFYGKNNTTDYWRIGGYCGSGDAMFSIYTTIGSSQIRRFCITHDGNVGINNDSPSYILDVIGTFRATGAATFGSTIHADGGIDSNSYITAGAVNSSSDARLKNNITSVVDAMDTIMALKPSEWIWNEKHHLNGQKGAGLVAQEVMGVLPFAVAKEGEYLSLNYDVFHAYEIAGLQNHEERIAYLENRVRELEARLGA